MNMRTVTSADGRLRRAFTVSDVERMVEVGLIGPDERLEVVAGELMPMSPKGAGHEGIKLALIEHVFGHKPTGIRIVPAAGWRLGEMLYLEPDILIHPAAIRFEAVRGPDALLVVEISDSTLGYDLGPKAAIYAREGVRETWIVDAATLRTHVHRGPGPDGYGDIRVIGPSDDVTAAFLDITVRFGSLDPA